MALGSYPSRGGPVQTSGRHSSLHIAVDHRVPGPWPAALTERRDHTHQDDDLGEQLLATWIKDASEPHG